MLIFLALLLSQIGTDPNMAGAFVIGAASLLGLIGMIIGIGSYFATRRELDKLERRVDSLETKLSSRVGKLHARVNRVLAGQMLIAGKLGVALHEMKSLEKELEATEALEHEEDELGGTTE